MKNSTKNILRYIVFGIFILASIGVVVALIALLVMKFKTNHTFYVEGQLISQEVYNLVWVWKGIFLGSFTLVGITYALIANM